MFGIKRLVLNDHNIKLRVLLFGVTTTALSYKMIKTGFWILKDRTCDCFFFKTAGFVLEENYFKRYKI